MKKKTILVGLIVSLLVVGNILLLMRFLNVKKEIKEVNTKIIEIEKGTGSVASTDTKENTKPKNVENIGNLSIDNIKGQTVVMRVRNPELEDVIDKFVMSSMNYLDVKEVKFTNLNPNLIEKFKDMMKRADIGYFKTSESKVLDRDHFITDVTDTSAKGNTFILIKRNIGFNFEQSNYYAMEYEMKKINGKWSIENIRLKVIEGTLID